MKLVNYQDTYYRALCEFVSRMWPERPSAYLEYRLKKIPEDASDVRVNLLAIDDQDNIVGCTLVFPTRAEIFGEEKKIYWSHDTIIESSCRGEIGMDLMLATNAVEGCFGIGLSPIARKIQKKLHTNFIADSKGYYIFNLWSLTLPLYRIGWKKARKTKKLNFPKSIKVHGERYELIEDIHQLRIPNDGFWNRHQTDIDLVRDEHFLRERFFENFNTYSFYRKVPSPSQKADDGYFVVRYIDLKGFPALSLVDFRYDLNAPDQFGHILKAIAKIAFRNRLPLSVARTTIEDKKYRLCPLTYRSDRVSDVVTRIKIKKPVRILVTQADSDTDFIR